MSDKKKAKNIVIAREVWRLRIDEKLSLSAIAKKLSIHTTEVSYILKYTEIEMYMDDDEIQRCLGIIQKCWTKNKNLAHKLKIASRPWWQKIFS